MNRALRCLILAGCSCLPAAAQANPAVEAAFATHCIACHGRDGEVNGDFDLRRFPAAADLVADPHLLGRIIEAVRDGEMPPEGEGDLPPAEREALVRHLDGLFAESVQTRAPPGRTPVRRMNRFQYGNAVTDLLELKVDLFTLPECIVRDLSGYFHPETGTMPDQVKVGNRVLGKGQLKAPRLEDVVPFPQDPRAANGYDNRADLLSLSPLLMESFLQLTASIFESPNFGPETCGAWTALFEAPPAAEPAEQALAARLGPFLTRAFRRPVDRDTLDRYVAFAAERLKTGAGFTAAMQAAAGAALASPRFLYLGDGATTGPAPEPLDGYELATRLSFFLWSSGPDDALLSAAGSGALRDPGVLAAQADRMMNDRRMKRFCDAFGSQWLKIESLASSQPDKKLFPDFHTFGIVSHAHRGSVHMMIEPLLVFETVFVENRSILDLVHSDFTYRTEHLRQFLAKAGKISPPIDGDNWSETLVFDRVPVTTKREGGVITTAAIMTMTSGPADTKPISRGKWVVETIFNDPPPPPPGNVPPIEEAVPTTAADKPLTLREKFAVHASSAAIALPWMESLQAAATPAGTTPACRVAFIYVPTGVIRDEFFPGEQTAPERTYQGPHPHTSSRTLRPLDPIAHKVTLVTNVDRHWMDASDQHEQCGCCWLSGVNARTHTASRMPQGRTLDHYLADHIGAATPFRTLEFNCNPHHDNRESIHYDSISWYGPDYAAGNMRDPVQAYRRLFTGGKTAPAQRITDLVLADARTLAARLGGDDRRKMAEYLDSIRAIEVQMDRLTAMQADLDRMNLPEPSVAHLPRSQYIGLFTDMLVAALQSGLTNVATMMIAPERWDTSYLFDGVSDKPLSHHLLSHEGWSEELRKIDEFHVQQFAALLQKMDVIREADGSTLLDNTILTYGSGLGQGAKHLYDRLPTVVAGGGGRLKTGFHLECKPGTPLANLWRAQARAVGVELGEFADSTGVLDGILPG